MRSKPRLAFSHNMYKNTFLHTIPNDYNTKEDKKPIVNKGNKKKVEPAKNLRIKECASNLRLYGTPFLLPLTNFPCSIQT